MIEDLTASLRGTTEAIDSSASARRDAWVARMVQFGALPILIAALLNIFEFHHAAGPRGSWALACAWFNGTLAVSTLCLTLTGWFTKHWRPVGFCIISALLASDTVFGTLGGEPRLLFISLLLLMFGTSSILPWSRRVQVGFNLLCVAAWVTQSFWTPALDRVGLHKLMGLLTAAALSYFTCYVRDRFVREYEESERIIRESEGALRQLFDANTDGITLIDLATRRIQDVNAYFLRISGFRREEVIGKSTDELNVWTDPAVEKEFVRRIQTDAGVTNMEVTFRAKDGHTIPCLLSSVIVVIRGRSCVMTLARDISDLRRSQEKLRESEEKFRLIFEASRDAIVVTRVADDRISDVNSQFMELSGYSRAETIGSAAPAMGLWAVPEQRATFLRGLAERGYIDGLEMSLRTRSGQVVPALISAMAVKLAGEDSYLAMTRDISHLREAEQKIRDSEATQRRIFNAALDWMSIIDMTTGDYLDVNESFIRATGYRREDLVGSNFFKLGLWPDQHEWGHFAEALVTNGEVRNQRGALRMKDGTLVPTLISGVQCELWGKLCCICTARDITELNAAQEKLRRSEETFRKIFDANLDAMSIVDAATGAYVDVNPEFIRVSGFRREEIIGRTGDSLNQWVNLDQRDQFQRVLAEKGEVRNMEAEGRLKDGRVVTCLTSGVLAEIGGKPCCLGVTRDISDLKAADQRLRKSEAMLRAIFDNSLDSISLLDLSTQTLVEVNAELSRVIGYAREEMIGKRFDELVPTADPVREKQLMAALVQGRELRNFEITFATRSGGTFPALLSSTSITIDGRPYTLGVTRDITDLVAAREAALAASKAKSEFLSTMSHEIRTPMNAILGMADLMGESDLNSEQRRYLDTILGNGNALLELINGILDLAKVESGRLSLESVEFDLTELIEHVADTLAIRAHEKGVELAVRFEPGLPSMLMGDAYRLRQILTNLIGNAIKFTRRGEVVISVERNPESAAGNFLFKVRDTGIGIPSDKIETIFSIFTQADTSTTRKFGGSGLGLAIVERLVGLMGGRVWVESELGKGSTFFFTIDVKAAKTPAREPLPAGDPRLCGLRVLLAAENATSRGIVAELLRGKGATVAEASSETEALAALDAAHCNGMYFGLMLVDCGTASIDGFEALRRIRAAAHAPVILLVNSHGIASKLRQMRKRGVEHYCIKPIKQRDLFGVIAEVMAKWVAPRVGPPAPRGLSPTSAAPAKSPAQKIAAHKTAARNIAERPLRILLADDSPDNRLLIRAYLRKTPYVLTETENGQIAFERFVDGSYDLVLMDIQMPVLDGYSAMRAIRKWELGKSARRTPIIALTASALEEDVRRAKAAGCDMHVSKPVKKSTLLDAIARAIDGHGELSASEVSGAGLVAAPAEFHS